ncbi:hypothetical protein WPS_17160 [Vulcanimicrobium alpinum]|uniref:Uncharacterized protein n=1 Tax=Vulcanimicrobium alpinum TaxID=3016050 RepID=A0AAN1XVZ7_UNVUL|nr:hypothetical protein WPS_17160 [Vulcanimicrobium alpinum]
MHAVEIVPRAGHPGDVVSIRFRARNHGRTPTPAASVRFVCDDALVPLGALSVDIEPASPGTDLVASLEVRLPGGFDDGTRFCARAVLALPDRTLETNAATIVLRCRPLLSGDASGATVEPLGTDGVRVSVAVTNEGDGPAHDVTLRIGAPAGTRARAGSEETVRVERLDPGGTLHAALEATIVEAVDELRAADVRVRTGDGEEHAVPARNAVVPEAALAARVQVRPGRRRSDVLVTLANDGWADATDVPVRMAIPAPLRIVDGSLAIDGMPLSRVRRKPPAGAVARVDGVGAAPALVIARVPARAACALTFAVDVPCDGVTYTAAIDAGGTALEAPLVAHALRDVRMRIVSGPGEAAPGATATFVVELVNLGDRTESLRVHATGDDASPQPAAVDLAAGTIARVALSQRVPDEAAGTLRRFAFAACDDDGDVAYAERYLIVGSPACTERSPRDAAPDDAPAVRVTVDAPAQVTAGAPFAVVASINVVTDAETLLVRAALDGARYVGGSTTVDRRGLFDRANGAPLEDGVVLRDVRGGTRVRVGWSAIADAQLGIDLLASCEVTADAHPSELAARRVAVIDCDPFAVRAADAAYAIDAPVLPICTTLDEIAAAATEATVPVPQEPEPVSATMPLTTTMHPRATLVLDDIDVLPLAVDKTNGARADRPFGAALALGADRIDAIACMLHTADGAGLATYLTALRVLVPDEPSPALEAGDVAAAAAYAAFRCAQTDVLDRLFVKLRIPGFAVTAADVEDATLRDAIAAFYTALISTRDARVTSASGRTAASDAAAIVPVNDARALLASLHDSPLGAPDALRAQTALIARRCDDDARVGAALDGYAAALDATLLRYAGAPLELFDCALAAPAGEALDEARRALLTACEASARVAEAAQ